MDERIKSEAIRREYGTRAPSVSVPPIMPDENEERPADRHVRCTVCGTYVEVPGVVSLTRIQLRELVEHLACIRTSFELWTPMDLTQLSGKEVSYAAALGASELLSRLAEQAGEGGDI